MFSWKKWFIKLGKKVLLVVVIEGGFVTSNYIVETQAELPPDYVHWALLASVIISQIANFAKHTWKKQD